MESNREIIEENNNCLLHKESNSDVENANIINEDIKDDIKSEINNKKFETIILDFINDIKVSFPEYLDIIDSYYENDVLKTNIIFEHCKGVYPERFFDILYKNEEIMKDKEINTEFLPDIDFKNIWKLDDISDSIKETIWKYLQLVLLSLVENIENKSEFGESAKIFEAMNNDIFKEKMEETMKNIKDLLENLNDDNEDDKNESTTDEESKDSTNNFLNSENIQEHISSLLDGKLGQLASEIAEETANDMGIDIENEEESKNMNNIMKDLFSNPTKIMDLVKKVGSKLDDKIKKGDIKESELLDEAGNIMKMMKDMPGMPGMKDLNKMFKSMGMEGMMPPGMGGKNTKLNTGAMKNHLKKKEMQDRMRKKAQERVAKMNNDKQVEREFEEKKNDFLNNKEIKEKSVDELLKEFNIVDEENQEKVVKDDTNKKKKKKKTKK